MALEFQTGAHRPSCVNVRCRGCLPVYRTPTPPAVRPRPFGSAPIPPPVAPQARALLIAFSKWMEALPSSVLGAEEWTQEQLVDLFIIEAMN